MPTINLPLDLSRGPVFPVRISCSGRLIKTYAMLSISSYSSRIASSLCEELGCLSLGLSRPKLFQRSSCPTPSHQINTEIMVGGLGRPIQRYDLPSMYVVQSSLPDPVGLVIGLQIIHQGILVCSRQGFSFSL